MGGKDGKYLVREENEEYVVLENEFERVKGNGKRGTSAGKCFPGAGCCVL